MRLASGIVATILGFTYTVAATPVAAPGHIVVRTEDDIELARRAGSWCVLFYTGYQDCSGLLTGGYCGSGPTGCTILENPSGPARSLIWLPGTTGLSLGISSNERCVPVAYTVYGPENNSNCRGMPANLAQFGASSFHVF